MQTDPGGLHPPGSGCVFAAQALHIQFVPLLLRNLKQYRVDTSACHQPERSIVRVTWARW